MSASNTSFGIKVGRALGNGAAYAVHGAALAAQSAGQFGRDVAAGSTVAYAEKSAELAEQRKLALAKALAMREQEVAVVAPAPAPARQRKLAVKA